MKDPAKKPCVLLVDDSPTSIRASAAALSSEYRVLAATSGPEALGIAAAHPDLVCVLMDIVMPEMDGFETAKRLRGDPATAGLPVVFVSGWEDEGSRLRARELDAAGYLLKPADADALRKAVATATARRKGRGAS